MRRSLVAPAAVVALMLGGIGCEPDLERAHQGEAGSGGVGAACALDSDCQDSLICATELPGGSCTRLCESSCPEASLCVRTLLSGSLEVLACAPLCGAGFPACRPGYRCVSVGRRSVCSL
jgi:hypothetical protein